MTQYWEPGTYYNHGDVVEYEGHRYKIIQPHNSQSDWTPPVTPALWGRLSDQDPNYGGDCKQQQPYQQQQQQQPQGQCDQQSQNQPQSNSPSNNEEKKHWYEDEEAKKKLEIGGGLAAGAALLAGGLFAYKKHEEHKEQGKADEWSHGNWLQEAKDRTNNYHRNGGGNEPATWVLTHNQVIPKGAILVGREKSWNLYICRAFYDGGIQLGKASEGFNKGGVLGYKNKEVFVEEYEVLVGDMRYLHWVPSNGKLNVASLGYRPVQGGKDSDGSPLYVVEAPYRDAVHPGKASEKGEGAYIAYDGKEVHIREYRVLCYNNNSNNNSY
jgi:hypothetical protein